MSKYSKKIMKILFSLIENGGRHFFPLHFSAFTKIATIVSLSNESTGDEATGPHQVTSELLLPISSEFL